MLIHSCRDKLKVASDELQKKKAYIDSLEPKVSSSGKGIEEMICEEIAIEQYLHVVLFIMLYKVVLRTFQSVDETPVCDHSNESY